MRLTEDESNWWDEVWDDQMEMDSMDETLLGAINEANEMNASEMFTMEEVE